MRRLMNTPAQAMNCLDSIDCCVESNENQNTGRRSEQHSRATPQQGPRYNGRPGHAAKSISMAAGGWAGGLSDGATVRRASAGPAAWLVLG
jgi:hypothetical protein